MNRVKRCRAFRSDRALSAVIATAFFAILLTVSLAQAAEAQTWTVLHDFTGAEGAYPYAGLTMDQAGNLYGTAFSGGHNNNGTVFKLTHKPSGWVLNVLYAFNGPDGSQPAGRVIIGPDGSLYGTTNYGGSAGLGTVFRLQPPQNICRSFSCPWTETVLHSFQGDSNDGALPEGELIFDQQGDIYGTAPRGGFDASNCFHGCGMVYKLTHAHGSWMESAVYFFQGANDGAVPIPGLIFDGAGNLYGTAAGGGTTGSGVVYKLTRSGSGWTQSVLFDFTDFNDGATPYGGLIFDGLGNLYGTTSIEGQQNGGTAYELSPSNGGWTFTLLQSFTAYSGSLAKLAMDPSGSLYGTLSLANTEVFKLTPSGGGWTLYDFAGGSAGSVGDVILDGNNNVYGTDLGGAFGKGSVFEITQ